MIMGMVSEKARVFSIAPHSAQKIALHLLLISKKIYGMILEAALAVISSTLLNVCILRGLNIKFFHFFKGKLKKRNCYTVKIITLC